MPFFTKLVFAVLMFLTALDLTILIFLTELDLTLLIFLTKLVLLAVLIFLTELVLTVLAGQRVLRVREPFLGDWRARRFPAAAAAAGRPRLRRHCGA